MCSCQSSLSINNPLDYANDLALISLFPTLPGPLPPFAWPTSLKVFSLFFVCAQSLSGFPPLTDLFFLSLLLRNLRATGKTLDSSLHPYQELRPTEGREGSLDSPADIMNSLEMVIWPVLAPIESK